jgi:hypothetical protein
MKSNRIRYAVAASCALLVTALVVWRGHAVAPAGRYDTSTAGVVVDTKTRLAWQKDVQSNLAHAAAKSYCAGLGGGWRLPSAHELMTIVDDTTTKSVKIDETVFNGGTALGNRNVWTATLVSGAPTTAWAVSFASAKIVEAGVAATMPLTRCVRLADQ